MTDVLTFTDHRYGNIFARWRWLLAGFGVFLAPFFLDVFENEMGLNMDAVMGWVFGGFGVLIVGTILFTLVGTRHTLTLRRKDAGFVVVEGRAVRAWVGPGPHRVELRDTPDDEMGGSGQSKSAFTRQRDFFVMDQGRVVVLSRSILTTDQAFARLSDLQGVLGAGAPIPAPPSVERHPIGGFSL